VQVGTRGPVWHYLLGLRRVGEGCQWGGETERLYPPGGVCTHLRRKEVVTRETPWGRAERGSVPTATTSLYPQNPERGVG